MHSRINKRRGPTMGGEFIADTIFSYLMGRNQ